MRKEKVQYDVIYHVSLHHNHLVQVVFIILLWILPNIDCTFFFQLCATKQGRLLIKEKNAYVILRELHKWEKDPKAKLVCTTVCELLISDEPSEDMEDLHKVEVPEHLHEKFNEMDKNELNDYMNESNEENK